MCKSVYVLTPITDAATQWIEGNVESEPYQQQGQGIVIEHRFIEDIVEGMVKDGLEEGVDFKVS